jgi:hypothetical protein
MILFVCLGYACPTFLTLVILARATNIMHSKFGHFNLLRANWAKFGFDWFFHYKKIL